MSKANLVVENLEEFDFMRGMKLKSVSEHEAIVKIDGIEQTKTEFLKIIAFEDEDRKEHVLIVDGELSISAQEEHVDKKLKRRIVVETVKAVISIITQILALTYILSLVQGRIAWMHDKSIFIQVTPLLIVLVVIMCCDETKGD